MAQHMAAYHSAKPRLQQATAGLNPATKHGPPCGGAAPSEHTAQQGPPETRPFLDTRRLRRPLLSIVLVPRPRTVTYFHLGRSPRWSEQIRDYNGLQINLSDRRERVAADDEAIRFVRQRKAPAIG